ncbi:MAG: ABC transporter permease [Oscillospiraceae bacterium]|nr:ABC transporter permease [Oscillospiraceae bacterium]
MARYLVKRIASAVLTMFFVTAIIYILLSLLQGTALDVMGGSGGDMTPAEYEAARHALGLDLPVWLRYVHWLRDVLRWDLGVSYRYGAPVGEVISQRFGPSALLWTAGLLFAVVFGLPIGVTAAYRPGSVWDRLSSFFALSGFAVPRFIACIAFIYFFSFRLRLFPAMGMHAVGDASFGDLLRHLFLPASIIGLGAMGYLIKQTRSACLETFHEDYLKTARAKGLSEFDVVVKHGLRAALAPILTQTVLQIPEIVGGSAITEKIFGWPGVGSLMIDAIRNRDTPLIMGVTLTIAAVVLTANIFLDLAYGLLDPRVTSR